TADRDENVFGGDFFSVHSNRVRVNNSGVALNDGYAGILKQLSINSVQTADLGVLVGDQFCPIDMPFAHCPAKTRGVLEILAEMCSVNQKLLRDATHVDAGPSQVALFRHGDLGAIGSGHTAGAHTAGTGADGKEVVIILRHDVALL